jgi:HNH endonuclease
MLRYFSLRPAGRGDDPDYRRWLRDELYAGRLREGWLSEVSLVNGHGHLVARSEWIRRARRVARNYGGTPSQKKQYRSPGFCPEKYDELTLMTEVQEGDVIAVLGLFEKRNDREGFVLVVARRAATRLSQRRDCYWYDVDGDQPKHVLSVRALMPEPRYDFVWEKYSKPIQRIRKDELITELEAACGRAQPRITELLPKFELVDKQRKKIERQIADRQGQPEFRRKLLSAYGRKCAISGCDVEQVLEAAHIVPHSKSATDDERNGILLRADLHTLLDKGFLGIKPSTRAVELHPDLQKTAYREFEGRQIAKTNPPDRRPDPKVLKRQYAWFQQVLAG